MDCSEPQMQEKNLDLENQAIIEDFEDEYIYDFFIAA